MLKPIKHEGCQDVRPHNEGLSSILVANELRINVRHPKPVENNRVEVCCRTHTPSKKHGNHKPPFRLQHCNTRRRTNYRHGPADNAPFRWLHSLKEAHLLTELRLLYLIWTIAPVCLWDPRLLPIITSGRNHRCVGVTGCSITALLSLKHSFVCVACARVHLCYIPAEVSEVLLF